MPLLPKEGEIWRNDRGAQRFVRSVEDNYSVTYSRPADHHRDWLTVPLRDWVIWAETSNASRLRKAPQVPDKEWAYASD